MKKPVLCLMGPTATGKTDAAAACFDAFDSAIVSVDSSLVYQGMDIGTAKPDADFLRQYPHALVNVRDPNETYSVAQFVHDATQEIEHAHRLNKLPILVGGTHFYFDALERGTMVLPQADEALRQRINTMAKKEGGWPLMHKKLHALDPNSAERIDPNDAQRIQRALEINYLTGQAVPERAGRIKNSSYKFIKLALVFSDRARLHQRIEMRYRQMLEAGLIGEVEQLLAQGVAADATAMKMIGYRQTVNYLADRVTLEESAQQGIAATRQLAKRQLTWLRNQSGLFWWVDEGLEKKEFSALVRLVKNALP